MIKYILRLIEQDKQIHSAYVSLNKDRCICTKISITDAKNLGVDPYSKLAAVLQLYKVKND
jgi:hypothetical protein